MVKRTKIGVIYSYNINWVAGAYYILNLIHALNKVEDEDKPVLVILSYKEEEFETVKETGYPYLVFHVLKSEDMQPAYSFAERSINFISRKIIRKNLIQKRYTSKRLDINLDLLFPGNSHIYFSEVKKMLFWIPDFQERFLPQFFSPEEIQSRKEYHQSLSDAKRNIVFSSYDAMNHFRSFYPGSGSQVFVLHFAVTHPDYSQTPAEILFEKFSIDKPYIFCPNQVWRHKNHITVLKAVKELKKKGENMLVVFSGKEYDNRNPHVFEELKNYIATHQLEEYVKFLGFIDRKEQLQLMKHAACVLQPSLFEGWSTSVEDAKAMQQSLIASDIPVHREQLGSHALFFDPENEVELAACLKKTKKSGELAPAFENYEPEIIQFGKKFIEIVNKISKHELS